VGSWNTHMIEPQLAIVHTVHAHLATHILHSHPTGRGMVELSEPSSLCDTIRVHVLAHGVVVVADSC
jgi:hypothetical protein